MSWIAACALFYSMTGILLLAVMGNFASTYRQQVAMLTRAFYLSALGAVMCFVLGRFY